MGCPCNIQSNFIYLMGFQILAGVTIILQARVPSVGRLYWQDNSLKDGIIDEDDIRLWGLIAGIACIVLGVLGLILEWVISRFSITVFAVFQFALQLSNIVFLVMISVPVSKVIKTMSDVDALLFFLPICVLLLFGLLSLVATPMLAHHIYEKIEAGFEQ